MIRIFNQYVSPKFIMLVGIETFLLAAALISAVKLRFWNDSFEFRSYTDLPQFGWQVVVVVITFQMCFYLNDLYSMEAGHYHDQVLRLGQAMGLASLLLGFLYFVVPSLLVARGVFFLNLLLAAAFIQLSRLALDKLWLVTPTQNILILGTGALAATVAQEIANRKDLNLKLLGFVSECPTSMASSQVVSDRSVIGPGSQLEALAAEQRVSRIIVALEDRRGILPTASLVKLRLTGIAVEDAHCVISALTGRVWLSTVRPSWFVFSDGFHRSRVTVLMKRTVDICFGIAGFVLSLPLMLAAIIAISLDSRGPVLYRQERVGWKGQPFFVLKFRSMKVDAEVHTGVQWAVVDDPRITRVGKYLRKFRLDELPQFVNIVRGDMSFVGPRPERPFFVEEFRKTISYYDGRHTVRPGLTGWAQVEYPYGACVEDTCRKLEYDLFYLKHMSLFFDLAIVFKTIHIVLTGRNSR